MKKIIKNVSLLTVVLVLSGSFSSCNNTLYEPGDVGRYLTENPLWLEPFDKTFDEDKSDDYWIVEQGVWLKYHHEGIPAIDNNRVVLVLHGGPGIPEYGSWPGLAGLEDEYSIYYYHQRGSGVSDNPFTGFGEKIPWRNMRRLEMTIGLTAQIADIERIRRILNIEKLILVGHSFGGFLAAMYASEFPDKVDKMVLVNPANVIVFPTKEKNIYESVRENLIKKSDDYTVFEYDAFLDEYLNYSNIVKKTDAELSRMNHKFSKYYILSGADQTRRNPPPVDIVGGWMVQAMYFSMGKKHDYSQALEEIQAETLLIKGAGDILKSDGWYERRILHITVEEMNTQHSPFLEKPEEFYNKMESFLNK